MVPAPDAAAAPVRRGLPAVLVVCAAVALAYANSLRGPFVFDDIWTIRDQLFLRSPAHLAELYALGPPRFLVMLSFAITYWFAGLTLWPYHAVNIALHALNCCLVHRLMTRWWPPRADGTRLAGSAALWATLGFALAPVHTQVVTYITGRAALLGTLALLLTVLAYARSRQSASAAGRRWWFALSLACYALGAFAKEIASVAPALLLAWEWCRAPDASRHARVRMLTRLVPYGVLLVATLVYRRAALGALALPVMPRSVGLNLLTQSYVTWGYALEEFLPRGLTIDHDLAAAGGWGDPQVWLGLALWGAAVALAWTVRRRAPWLTLGLAWFGITLLPESSLIPMQDIMADHRAYLPAIGLWSMGAYGWGAWHAALGARGGPGRLRLAHVVSVAILALFAFGTVYRNTVWREPIRLWREAVRHSPDHARPLANLAGYYVQQKQYQLGLETADAALALDPTMTAGYLNRGLAALELGRLTQAESDFSSFLSLYAWEPRGWITARGKLAVAQYDLGLVYTRQRRFAEAVEAFERALKLNPIDRTILNSLGHAHERLGQFELAELYIHMSLQLPNPSPRDWNRMVRIRQIRSIVIALRKEILADPKDVLPNVRLGIYLDDLGVYDRAERAYRAAAAADPLEPLVPMMRGNLYRRTGRTTQAVAAYRKVLALQPDSAEALWWLGQIRLAQGIPFEAQPLLIRARELDPEVGTRHWRPVRQLRDGRVIKS